MLLPFRKARLAVFPCLYAKRSNQLRSMSSDLPYRHESGLSNYSWHENAFLKMGNYSSRDCFPVICRTCFSYKEIM